MSSTTSTGAAQLGVYSDEGPNRLPQFGNFRPPDFRERLARPALPFRLRLDLVLHFPQRSVRDSLGVAESVLLDAGLQDLRPRGSAPGDDLADLAGKEGKAEHEDAPAVSPDNRDVQAHDGLAGGNPDHVSHVFDDQPPLLSGLPGAEDPVLVAQLLGPALSV